MTQTRMAKCSYSCGNVRPSSPDLAFFMDRSAPQDGCNFMVKREGDDFLGLPSTEAPCGYTAIAHERFSGRLMDVVMSGRWPRGVPAHEFEQRTEGEPMDEYYCGCFGWD